MLMLMPMAAMPPRCARQRDYFAMISPFFSLRRVLAFLLSPPR